MGGARHHLLKDTGLCVFMTCAFVCYLLDQTSQLILSLSQLFVSKRGPTNLHYLAASRAQFCAA
jgi:hypothetical protein